jgi:hypothetical protein
MSKATEPVAILVSASSVSLNVDSETCTPYSRSNRLSTPGPM